MSRLFCAQCAASPMGGPCGAGKPAPALCPVRQPARSAHPDWRRDARNSKPLSEGLVMSKHRARATQGAITQSQLKSLLHYNAETGAFTWAIRQSNKLAGSLAGHTDSRGYWRIKIQKRSYRAHRLAWLYINGELPSCIDHIDGNTTNNAISNLRCGENGVNQQNVRRPQRNNKSGFLGIHKRSDSSTYRACVSVNGKLRYFGAYKTPEEAHAAYLEKKRQLHAGCAI